MNRLKHIYNWFYARTRGYFWLPYPLCGKNFGGHEEGKGDIMTTWGQGQSTCPDCKDRANEYNKKWIETHPHPGIVMNVGTWDKVSETCVQKIDRLHY